MKPLRILIQKVAELIFKINLTLLIIIVTFCNDRPSNSSNDNRNNSNISA